MPDDALERDRGSGVHGPETVGVGHRRHLGDHGRVDLEETEAELTAVFMSRSEMEWEGSTNRLLSDC